MLSENCLPWSQIDEWVRLNGGEVFEADRNHLAQQLLSKLVLEDLKPGKEQIADQQYAQSIKYHVDHQHGLLVEALRKINGGRVPEIPHALRYQAKLAVALGLDTIDPVLITAAYDQLEEDVKERVLLVEEKKDRLKQKEAELQTLQEKHAALKEFHRKYDETLEQRDCEARMTESNLLMLRQKKIEYEQCIREASNRLGNHITVDQVDALFDQFQNLQKQRTELKSRLDAFNGLPADRTLARIKVAEAEQDLQILIDRHNRLLKSRGH